jgi:hypothetical protein
MDRDVDETLIKRGNVYGDYSDTIEARAMIMAVLKKHYHKTNGKEMDTKTFVMLGDLVMKLVRASGSPDHADTYHDIAGYAKLIEREQCEEK